MKLKLPLFVLICFSSLYAQVNRFSATTGDVSLSGAGTALTIQQPATNGKTVVFETAVVYCSVTCTVTQSQNGTAATATAGTAVPILPTPTTTQASATVWTASNAGTGTSVGGALHIASAPGTVVLDLSKVVMGNGGTGTNYTITVGSITGTANITVYWSEK